MPASNKILTKRISIIFLLIPLFYVLFEAGRFVLLQNILQATSGQAARYGSATGKGTNGIPRYQDCAGIRAAAKTYSALKTLHDEDIGIKHDTGPGTPETIYCTPEMTTDTSFKPDQENKDRISVTVKKQYAPLIPLFTKTLSSTSARTILVSVSIEVSPQPATLEPTDIANLSVEQQLARIDSALKQTISASIAYNAPQSMKLGDTVTISLLLNPSVTPENLATQVQESGQVATHTIEVTSRMKAVLIPQVDGIFSMRDIHDDPEQLISATETTTWSWYVTAKEKGTHSLTLVIYRLIAIDGQEDWREVESYKSDISVEVTLGQQLTQFDWTWILGILLTAIIIPAFWRWMDARKKREELAQTQNQKEKTPRKPKGKKVEK